MDPTEWNGSRQTGAVFFAGGLMHGYLIMLQDVLDEADGFSVDELIELRARNRAMLDRVERIVFGDEKKEG